MKILATLGIISLKIAGMNITNASFFDEDRKASVSRYIKDNAITRDKVTAYAPVFPDRAMRNLIESEVIYSVAP